MSPIVKRAHFVTPSGRTVRIEAPRAQPADQRDATVVPVDIIPSGGKRIQAGVVLVIPDTIRDILHSAGFPDLVNEPIAQGIIAAIDLFDRGEISGASDVTTIQMIDVTGRDFAAIVNRVRLEDSALRRYIVRRLYDNYSRTTLDDGVLFDDIDFIITGARAVDFVRNTQVLEAEGYLRRTHRADGVALMPVAPLVKLVRDVERYGSAKDDAIADVDYTASVRAMPALGPWADSLLEEHRRYATAINAVQLASVFKSVAPTVEAIAKALVQARGSQRALSTLGEAIGEMKKRGIGDVSLMSKLAHVLEFARNVELHGGSLSTASLRIGCETAFDLSLELGALFP